MKKKLVAVGLSLVLTLSMSFTAMAASSSTSSNSGNQEETSSSSSTSAATPSNPKPVAAVVEEKQAGESIEAAAVQVTMKSADGTVSVVTLDEVVSDTQSTLVAAISSPAQAVVTVQALMKSAPTPFFTQTIEALASMKGSSVVVNDCGTVKTAAVVADALGNNIASAGVIKNVKSGALIMLMSVNADGTIEYVEGVVDPVTGAVVGAFKGVPATITVLVLA